MKCEPFNPLMQPANGMDAAQWHKCYEAFWSNQLARLKERLESEQFNALSHDVSRN